MTNHQAKALIKQLEETVRFWQSAYRKAVKHDQHVIQQVKQEVQHADR